MRLKSIRSSRVKKFPFEDIQLNDEGSLIEKYLCSPETNEDVSNMEEASKHNYKLKYCLFTKHFQKDEERICKNEVQPLFMEIKDEETNSIECGFTEHHFMHGLSYYVRIFHHSFSHTL